MSVMLKMSFHYWEADAWELINWRKLLQAYCLTWQTSLWGLAGYPLCSSPVWMPKIIHSVEGVCNCRAGYSSTIYWSTDVLYLHIHKVIALCWLIRILWIYFESLNFHCISVLSGTACFWLCKEVMSYYKCCRLRVHKCQPFTHTTERSPALIHWTHRTCL
jgi:hypothetical protein